MMMMMMGQSQSQSPSGAGFMGSAGAGIPGGASLTGGAGFPGGNLMFQMMMMIMSASDNLKSNCEEKSDLASASAESSSEKCLEDNAPVMAECQTNAENERIIKGEDKEYAAEVTAKCVMRRVGADCGKIVCKAFCFSFGEDYIMCKNCKAFLYND